MSFDAALADLEKRWPAKPVALTLPIGDETRFQRRDRRARDEGAASIADASGKAKEEELSGELEDPRRGSARQALRGRRGDRRRAARKISRAGRTLDDGDLRPALRAAVLAGKLTPVLCGSGAKNIGIGPLLDAIATLDAGAQRTARRSRRKRRQRQSVERAPDPAAPFCAFVFKTVIDPFAGKLSIFRVVSGTRASATPPCSIPRIGPRSASASCCGSRARSNRRSRSRYPARSSPSRSSRTPPPAIRCVTRRRRLSSPRPRSPMPVISFAIRPKTRGDEEKASTGAAAPGRGRPRSGNPSRPADPRDYPVRHRPDAYRGHGRKAQAQV